MEFLIRRVTKTRNSNRILIETHSVDHPVLFSVEYSRFVQDAERQPAHSGYISYHFITFRSVYIYIYGGWYVLHIFRFVEHNELYRWRFYILSVSVCAQPKKKRESFANVTNLDVLLYI